MIEVRPTTGFLEWLRGLKDLESVEVANRGRVPITLKQLAAVQLGPEFRRSALEKNGQEAVLGVALKDAEDPAACCKLVK